MSVFIPFFLWNVFCDSIFISIVYILLFMHYMCEINDNEWITLKHNYSINKDFKVWMEEDISKIITDLSTSLFDQKQHIL